jgi:hypothetical protein
MKWKVGRRQIKVEGTIERLRSQTSTLQHDAVYRLQFTTAHWTFDLLGFLLRSKIEKCLVRVLARDYALLAARFYSSMVLTHSQPPLNLSFHKLTRLSPVLTARTLPLKLQLTRHATASTLRTVDFHSPACC